MEKPHICFISESRVTYSLLTGEACSKVGGAEVQQTLLASMMRGLGYGVSFLVPDMGQPEEMVTHEGIRLVKIRAPKMTVRGLKYFNEIGRFFGAMKRANADLYYQRAGSPVTGITALYCRSKKKPFVFSLASNMDLDGTWKRGMGRHYYWLYTYGLKNADVVVAQTDDQMCLLKDATGKDGVLIRSTFAEPTGLAPVRKSGYVLWVGNFWAIKRPAMYLELASRLSEYRFVMVGGPHAGEEHVFSETSKASESVKNLEFVGPAPFTEVGGYFDGASVFVNTSADEGFPNTYLQAWCRGVPVVGTFDADGLISRYGLGKKCDDLDGLVSAVDGLMKDDELRGEIGETARLYVDENHSPERVAVKYDQLFMSLVD